jgi:hypothetical protein
MGELFAQEPVAFAIAASGQAGGRGRLGYGCCGQGERRPTAVIPVGQRTTFAKRGEANYAAIAAPIQAICNVRSRCPAANWFQPWPPTGRSIRTRARTSRYLTRTRGGDCGGAELSDRTPSNLRCLNSARRNSRFACAGSRQDREFERASRNALFGR